MLEYDRSVASNQRQRRRPPGQQRLALLVFGSVLILLFFGFAIAHGIGDPSLPSGTVAIVEDAPGNLGTVTEEDLDYAIEQKARAGSEPLPQPGGDRYEELRKGILDEILSRIWIQGKAEEMGVLVMPGEVSKRFEKWKDEVEKWRGEAFGSDADYEKFLREFHLTQAEVDERVKIPLLSARMLKWVKEAAPAPSHDEIEEYYEATKSSQFFKPETRDLRSLVFKDKGEAEKAKAQLEADDSPASWKKLAAKSANPTFEKTGGLQKGLHRGQTSEPLNTAIFAAPSNQLEGLVKGLAGYIVFEVIKVNPEEVQALEEVESQIKTQLSEEIQTEGQAEFIRDYRSTWTSRTFCTPDLTIEMCANFKGDGRPPSAPPGCYEAAPKETPEACPAPVQQLIPVLPGSIDILTPEGQKLAQRPRPAGPG